MCNEAISTLNTWEPEDFEIALHTHAVGAPVTTKLKDLPATINIGPENSIKVLELENSVAAINGDETLIVETISNKVGQRQTSWLQMNGSAFTVNYPTIQDNETSVFDAHWHPSDDPPSIEDALSIVQPSREPFASVVLSPKEAWLLVRTLDTKSLTRDEILRFQEEANEKIWRRAQELTVDIFKNQGNIYDPMKAAQIEVLEESCKEIGLGLYHARRDENDSQNGLMFEKYSTNEIS